jgi:hypothetical protein
LDLVETMGRAERWRTILLIDETEELTEKKWSKEFCSHLRGIHDSDRRNLLKVTMAGSKDFYGRVNEAGSQLIGALQPQLLLRPLSRAETEQLVQQPCDQRVPAEVTERIYHYSGGHPFVVHWLMSRLWPALLDREPPDAARVDELADRFLVENKQIFSKWRTHIGEEGLEILGFLIKQRDRAPGAWFKSSQIKKELERKKGIEDQLTTLLYHGVVYATEKQGYQAAGEIFCKWYRENVDEEPASPLVTVSTIHVLPTTLAHSNRSQAEKDFPLVKVRLDNSASNCRKACVRVSVSIEGYSHRESNDYELNQEIIEVSLLPRLTKKALKIHTICPAQISVQVTDLTARNKSLHHRSYDVSLYPADTAVLWLAWKEKTLSLFNYLTAWVTYSHESLQEVLIPAAQKLPDLGFTGYAQGVEMLREQARGIYEALQELRLEYVESSFALKIRTDGFIMQEITQRVRFPQQSLREKRANCLDGAVLFASLLLAVKIHPVIVLVTVPGFHAFAGWKLMENGPVDGRLLEFVDASQFSVSSFDQAQANAKSLFQQALEQRMLEHSPDDDTGFATIIDVVECLERQGYHPLE